MTTTIKAITKNINLITSKGNSIRLLAEQTATMIIEHGQTTSHYDKAPNLVAALETNKQLQKDILVLFAGKIPHSIRQVNGQWKLGKKDNGLLLEAEQLAERQQQTKEKRAEATAKTAAKRAADKEKLSAFDALVAENAMLKAEVEILKAQLASKTKAKTAKAA